MLCQGSAGVVSVMVAAAGGCWAAIQLYQVSIVVVVVVVVVVMIMTMIQNSDTSTASMLHKILYSK